MAKRSNAKKVAQVEINDQDNEMEQIATAEAVTEKKGRKQVEKIELSKAQQKEYDDLKTKSARIRYLASQSFSRGSIADFLQIRYQHVRNVLETPLKRSAE